MILKDSYIRIFCFYLVSMFSLNCVTFPLSGVFMCILPIEEGLKGIMEWPRLSACKNVFLSRSRLLVGSAKYYKTYVLDIMVAIFFFPFNSCSWLPLLSNHLFSWYLISFLLALLIPKTFTVCNFVALLCLWRINASAAPYVHSLAFRFKNQKIKFHNVYCLRICSKITTVLRRLLITRNIFAFSHFIQLVFNMSW